MRKKSKGKNIDLFAPKHHVPTSQAPKTSRSKPAKAVNDDDIELHDEDLHLLNEYGASTAFLARLTTDYLTRNVSNAQVTRIPRATIDTRISDEDDDSDMDSSDMNSDVDSSVMDSSDLCSSDFASDMDGSDENISNRVYTPKEKKVKLDHEDRLLDFESKPRTVSKNWIESQNPNTRLPIINAQGKLRPLEARDDLTDVPSKKKIEKPLLKTAKTLAAPKDKKESERISIKSMKLSEMPERLAELATNIMEDPENNVNSLRTLREFSLQKNHGIIQLALLTQLAVYKNIIPGYRIRQLTDEERSVKVSKDVQTLRAYEQTLVTCYQQYIKDLQQHIKKQISTEVYIQATTCVTELLQCASHFNFRSTLLDTVIQKMSVHSPLQVGVLCCNAISKVFIYDESGEISLETVQQISSYLKSKKFKCNEEVLKTLLHLRLKDELSLDKNEKNGKKNGDKKRKKDRLHFSKTMRRKVKEEKEVIKEMKEAEAVVDQEERKKRHTETLKHLFVIYFRILKEIKSKNLISAVLEGLSQFAHLISVDFFSDVLELLKKIAFEQQEEYQNDAKHANNLDSSLNCVLAAFKLLSGQESILNIDLKDFVDIFYNLLLRIPGQPFFVNQGQAESKYLSAKSRSNLESVLHCFELMFLKNKQVSMERMASFIKRLASITLHLPVRGIMQCLSIIKQLLIKYPVLERLIDDDENDGSGVYSPMQMDPDLAHASSSKLIELPVLMFHNNADVRLFARCISKISLSNSMHTENRMPPKFNVPTNEMNFEGDEGYMPFVRDVVGLSTLKKRWHLELKAVGIMCGCDISGKTLTELKDIFNWKIEDLEAKTSLNR